jgi:hypothetical protein
MKMSKTLGLLVSILLASSVSVLAQNPEANVPSPLSLEVRPAFDMPLGTGEQLTLG